MIDISTLISQLATVQEQLALVVTDESTLQQSLTDVQNTLNDFTYKVKKEHALEYLEALANYASSFPVDNTTLNISVDSNDLVGTTQFSAAHIAFANAGKILIINCPDSTI